MKKKVILATMIMTFAFTATACGSSAGDTSEPVNVASDTVTDTEPTLSASENEEPSAASGDIEEEVQHKDAKEEETPDADMEQQYKDMAAKFAVYCENIYLDYEIRGTVTTGDITISDDTETQCRLTIYYIEPAVNLGNMSTNSGMGYMEFVIDKTTSQGQMEAWNFLIGSDNPDFSADQDNPEVADMTGEASAYYDFPENPVFDFKEGLILSDGSVVADMNDYFKE